MFELLAGWWAFNKAGGDGTALIAKATEHTLIVLLGAGLAIVAIIMIISGSKAGQLAGTVAELVATKGASIAK